MPAKEWMHGFRFSLAESWKNALFPYEWVITKEETFFFWTISFHFYASSSPNWPFT